MTKANPSLREVARKLYSKRGYRLPCGNELWVTSHGDYLVVDQLFEGRVIYPQSLGSLSTVFAALAKYPTAASAKGGGGSDYADYYSAGREVPSGAFLWSPARP